MSKTLIQHMQDLRTGFTPAVAAGTTTAFQIPDDIVSGRMDDENQFWFPIRPSIASRRPAMKSRGSCRGAIIDYADNRELYFESNLEAGLAYMLVARNDVARVVDQPPAVAYTDSNGKAREHTFDFMAVTADGVHIAFAVKPEAKVEKSGIRTTLELIRQQVGARFADRYLLRTEKHITRDRVFNARLILHARRGRNQEDVARLKDIVATLHGDVRINDVVGLSGLGGRGFYALVNLIGDGALELAGPGRIDYRATVRRVAVH
jgi:hypothetical protein